MGRMQRGAQLGGLAVMRTWSRQMPAGRAGFNGRTIAPLSRAGVCVAEALIVQGVVEQ